MPHVTKALTNRSVKSATLSCVTECKTTSAHFNYYKVETNVQSAREPHDLKMDFRPLVCIDCLCSIYKIPVYFMHYISETQTILGHKTFKVTDN